MAENSNYAIFIEDCRRERASLAGLIEALENEMLGAGMPIIIPAPMSKLTADTLAAFKRTIVSLDALIAAYEAGPDA
jgi:hypothetical protein